MPAFQYKAMDTQASHQGILEGDSARLIRQQLRDKNFACRSLTCTKNRCQSQPIVAKGVGAYDLALITRQLSVLLAASIPIEQALQAIAKQSENRMSKRWCMACAPKYWKAIAQRGATRLW